MVRRSLSALALAALGLAVPQAADAQYGYTVGPIATGNGATYGGYGINGFNNRLTNDPYLTGATLNARLLDNTMYMRGTVPTLAARMRAQRLAESYFGYGNYVDETTVRPRNPVPDPELQQKIKDEIFAARLADELDVDVSIDDGVVTIEADRLSRRHEQMLVESIANLNGVKDVQVDINGRTREPRMNDRGGSAGGVARNDRQRRPEGNAPDAPASEQEPETETLANRVRRSLEADSRVPTGRVEADVTGSLVTLTGTVNTLGEKRAAVSAAYVPGVEDVEANGLDISSDYSAPNPGESAENRQRPEPPSDAEVRMRVRQRVNDNPRLRGNDISLSVQDRDVTVEGTVDSIREKEELYEAVRMTRGVKNVDFEVNTTAEENVPEDLKGRVETRLSQLGFDGLTVGSAKGDVFVRGDVPSPAARRRIANAVKDIPGVKSYQSDLTPPDDADVDGDGDGPIPDPDQYGPNEYDPAVDDIGAFQSLTNYTTRAGAGSATAFGGGAVISGATPREMNVATAVDLPDGVDAEGDAKRGKPLASPGADDAPSAEVTSADPDEEFADKSFEKIKEAVRSHPRLREHDIELKEVGEGRIIASGSVDDWYEYSLIRSLIYDAGARDVEMTVTVY